MSELTMDFVTVVLRDYLPPGWQLTGIERDDLGARVIFSRACTDADGDPRLVRLSFVPSLLDPLHWKEAIDGGLAQLGDHLLMGGEPCS